MASEWRVDVDSEGELGDVVAPNSAYPDEIMVLAEFTDPADAARCVEAVNALPGLRSEVARLKAALAAAEAELTRACANHAATADALLAAEARAEKAEAANAQLARELGLEYAHTREVEASLRLHIENLKAEVEALRAEREKVRPVWPNVEAALLLSRALARLRRVGGAGRGRP